ncbi:MAG: MFS transporter [Phenylobacterium sp.]|uniref:MFS transporter n=1 Tax=Phenylobacterium sp. TaxID=1871053 RepID=UPI0039193CB5
MTSPSALAERDFARLWAAQAVSAFGARITREGLPIVAVVGLSASPAALGALAAVSGAAALVAGLAGGGPIDHTARRPLLIGADLVRGAVLITLPLAAWLGAISLVQLFVAAALVAAASAVFDIASHAYLPGLIGREALVDGNAKLSATDSVAEVGGPALAGLLFQWLTAPIAIAGNALTYLVSAAFLATIRKPEPPPEPSPPEPWLSDMTAGFRLALAHPLVRPILLVSASHGLFGGIFAALYVLFCLKVLGLGPAALGIAIAAGGAGALAGSMLAPRLDRRLGSGPTILLCLVGVAGALVLTPLAPADPERALAWLIASQVFGDAFGVMGLIVASTLRQTAMPQAVLGRVGGAFHAAGGGMAVLGALAGGLLGELIGARGALWIAWAGFALTPLIVLASPLRRARSAAA